MAREHGLYRASDLRQRIVEKTGIVISLQNLCNLINHKPPSLRLKTIEILCTALDCSLADLCEVKPGKFDRDKVQKLSYQTTPNKHRGAHSFPDPEDYR